MMTLGANENDPSIVGNRNEPDAHGQAALMLVESLLHTLVETGALSLDRAVSAVATAREIKAEVATAAGESRGRMQASLDLLNDIADSLEKDVH
jgi:hypothetical protein